MKKKLDASFSIRHASIVCENDWLFEWDEGSVYCAFVFEIIDDKLTDQIAQIDQLQEEDDDQIEYL